jgi:aminocarboxymuconate-semialdehyde decarboxylase
MRIDIHTHILPENLPDLSSKYDGTAGWISIVKSKTHPNCACMMKDGKLFRQIEKNCWSLNERYDEMKAANVTTQVLSTVPVMFNYAAKPEHTLDLCNLLNDDLFKQINTFQQSSWNNDEILKSFYGFGTLPMQDSRLAVEEMTRCFKDLGFKGIQIGSHINEWLLNDKNLYPIWKRAEDLQCPIFVHPWDMDHITKTNKYWLPWLVGMPAETANAICCLLMGGVLQQFPRLKFCFAHGGGAFPFTIGRIQHGYEVRPDLCAIEFVII